MSNLKDTDTDDLFRRASEKYPLRTDSSDWDGMAAALEKNPPAPDDGTDTTDERRKRRFFWLFLLLPLGVGGLGYYAWHSGARAHAATTAKASVVTNTATAAAGNASDAANSPDKTNTTGKTNTPDAGNTSGSALTPAAASTPAATNTPSATGTPAANSSAASATSTRTRIAPATTAGGATAATTGLTTARVDRGRLADAGHQGNTGNQGNAGHQPGQNGAFADASTVNNTPASGNPLSISLAQNRQDRLFYDLQREPVDRNYELKVNVAAPAAKKDSNAAKQKTTAKTKTSYLYAGIIGAPDLSTVKMQAVKEVGNTFGVLVGYAFSPHWAIETGAYLDRKKYYTEGQYFSKTEIRWPPTDTLNDVNGTCYMWEIPLNLRYTFNPGAKTRWFATAGFTTYIMTKEKYTYNYEESGWAGTTKGNIDTTSHYPFSIISLSVGFEQKLGKVGNLRIEPYLRIPLTGMGAGKLPIMSTGINIGITRQLWKK